MADNSAKSIQNVEKSGKNSRKTRENAKEIVIIPISEVRPYGKNPRKNEAAVKYVKASIEKFGFKIPIIIDKNRVIVCGHTRLLAAKSLGMTEVPCLYADDLTDAQIKAFRLADNKVSEFAEWDDALLGEELADIGADCDIDMTEFGFDDNMDGNEQRGVNLEDSTYQIIIECSDEMEQNEFYDKLSSEGYKCRLSTL